MLNKKIIPLVVALFVLLFVYAATNKLLDFYTFSFQLGKSPLIPQNLTKLTALMIPIGELLIVALLITEKLRLIGLFLSFFLMLLFTVYLYFITRYSYYIPCSCGGILGKMDWDTHIYFNIFFILISVIAIYMHNPKEKITNKNYL